MNFETKEQVYSEFSDGVTKVLDHLKTELASIRAGRANPKILDKVMVNYYGSLTPLNQMANITVPDPRCLLVNVWDMSALKDVVKAINEANLGLNPADDGKSVRLVFPVLTEDRRKELAKNVHKISEEMKISIRNVRRDCMDGIKEMKKDNLLTEDEQAQAEKEIQKLLDNANASVDKLVEAKEKEVMDI